MRELLEYLAFATLPVGDSGNKTLFGGISNPLIMVVIIGGTVLAMLPESPFRMLVNYTLNIPEARYWAWIVPIREFALFFEAVASCYYVYAVLYAVLKYCNIVK